MPKPFIASSTARHLISPVVTGTDFKIRPRISFNLVKRIQVGGCKETRTRSGLTHDGYLDGEALERELFLFMKNSRNPNEFPSKKQLLDAGRADLVTGVTKTGGWLALGWDYSEDENDYKSNHLDDVEGFQLQHRHNLYGPSLQHSASSTGRSLEEDTGVEGILNRLEKQRSLSFDIQKHASSKDNGAFSMSTDVAAKIDSQLQETQRHYNTDLNPDKIRSRLQHMQLELSSAIHSLRSKTRSLNPEDHEGHGSELQHLSDVWEFQENEVMKAGDKLRSVRAKLAVLQGKIALSVIDTQKLVEEKQRKIDSARTTLQLLRTTCIFWTHSASEVLLVGSFDGWTCQVKMEKTRAGIFFASLKLYPGRYEIKFIVDGIWRVDPMLHVVHNNGYENNSLIVHE